ncbi:MAG: serine/threonine-protein kinase [Actinomycetota bacterium]|nr:serine/threonine-protein kinase [Actinomycetota bacterium]
MSLLGRLGSGGMGVVYLARQGDGDLVALKVIRPDLTADPQFRSRFTQEVRHALRVRGPFLAEAREASTSLTPQFIAWVYVPGEDLGVTVRSHGPLLPDEVAALAAALADSLGRLHSAGVVHRDVKPSNIQIGPRGPILLDLGVSKSTDTTSLTTTAMSIGTPAWMSPEQWRGAEHGPPGDIWNWGAVVAFAAGGTHPFGSGTGEALGYRVLHESPAVPPLGKPLGGLVAAALDKDPENRPDWREILNALDTDPTTVSAYVASRWGRLGRLAFAPVASEDAPTVLMAGTPDPTLALPATRLEPAGKIAGPAASGVRRAAFVAAVAALLLAGAAIAIIIGQTASAPTDPPAPTPTPAATQPAPTSVPGTASAEPPAASTPPTVDQPAPKPTKDHGKPSKQPK